VGQWAADGQQLDESLLFRFVSLGQQAGGNRALAHFMMGRMIDGFLNLQPIIVLLAKT